MCVFSGGWVNGPFGAPQVIIAKVCYMCFNANSKKSNKLSDYVTCFRTLSPRKHSVCFLQNVFIHIKRNQENCTHRNLNIPTFTHTTRGSRPVPSTTRFLSLFHLLLCSSNWRKQPKSKESVR